MRRLILGEDAMLVGVVGAEEPHPRLLDSTPRGEGDWDPFVTALLSVYIFSALLIVLTTGFWRSLGIRLFAQWFTETGRSVRTNIQKAVFYNIAFNTTVLFVYVVLPSSPFDPVDGTLSDCFCPLQPPWMIGVLCVLIFSFVCLRYMAHSMRHTRDFSGYVVYSPPPAHQMASFFTSKFGRVVALSSVMFGLPIALSGLLLQANTAELSDLSAMYNFVLCAPHDDLDATTWIVTAQFVAVTTLLTFLPVIVALAMEHINFFINYRNIKTTIPGFYIIINSPFVTSQLVTVWPSWLIAMTLTAQLHTTLPRLFCAVWAIVAPMDSLAMLCIFIVASCVSRK